MLLIEVDFNPGGAAQELVVGGAVGGGRQRGAPRVMRPAQLFRDFQIIFKPVEDDPQCGFKGFDVGFEFAFLAILAGEVAKFDDAVLVVDHLAEQRVTDAEPVLFEEDGEVEGVQRDHIARLRRVADAAVGRGIRDEEVEHLLRTEQ